MAAWPSCCDPMVVPYVMVPEEDCSPQGSSDAKKEAKMSWGPRITHKAMLPVTSLLPKSLCLLSPSQSPIGWITYGCRGTHPYVTNHYRYPIMNLEQRYTASSFQLDMMQSPSGFTPQLSVRIISRAQWQVSCNGYGSRDDPGVRHGRVSQACSQLDRAPSDPEPLQCQMEAGICPGTQRALDDLVTRPRGMLGQGLGAVHISKERSLS